MIVWTAGIVGSLAPSAGAADGHRGLTIPLDHSALVLPGADTPQRGPCYCPETSRRNLLERDRDAVYRPGRIAAGAMFPRTLRVLAVRIQFPQEEPDDPNTTGNGRFDLRDSLVFRAENGHNFDGSPHDKRYFETHLRALHLYWNTVSNGELSLEWTVFPQGDYDACEVPEPLAYYGRERDGDSGVVYGLEQFVIDAATAASADPELVFEDYDAVIFFHAGSDRQSDIAQNTPHDLFTGFVRLGRFVSLSAGVSDQLTEAIIMPETLIQDNRITVLNGVLAHEFGHQLGLVDLYSTRSGLTQVGNFSLMDNNAADVGVDVAVNGRRRILFGALPVFPDAWSRLYLGFASANEVENQQRVLIPAAETERILPQATPQIVKIPISQTEYYLVENRRFDIDARGDAALRLDSVTNVVLEPVDTFSVSANREYDFLLPGQGLLIWHVDEGVAALDYVTTDDIPNNFQANTLQWESGRRFLRLIEADGLVNFGGYFSAGNGGASDYFYAPHNTLLNGNTNPPAISNAGGKTGISISNISAPAVDMTMDVAREGALPGFPVYAGRDSSAANALVIADVRPVEGNKFAFPGDGEPELFAAYKHYILAWNWQGVPLAGHPQIDTVPSFDTSFVTRQFTPVARGEADDGGWIAPPIIVDRGVAPAVIVAVARNGITYVWKMADDDQDGWFDRDFTRGANDNASAPPIAWNRGDATLELFVPTYSGRYEIIGLINGIQTSVAQLTGSVIGAAGRDRASTVATFRRGEEWWFGSLDDKTHQVQISADSLLAPAVGDIDRDSSLDAAVLEIDGTLWVLDTGMNVLPGFPVDLGADAQAPPVLADADRDGYLDIITLAGGYAFAHARNGALLPNFPVPIGRTNAPDSTAGAPAVIDNGEEGQLTLITAGQRRNLLGYNAGAGVATGYPWPVGGSVDAPVAWGNNRGNTTSAVFTRASDGFIYAHTGPYVPAPATAIWPMDARDARRTRVVPIADLEDVSAAGEFFVAERAFVYPNPARDQAVVRYWLGDEASVHIRIFDLAGNLVTETDGPGDGGLYNEWTWNCSNVASGVYFAHLEVVGALDGRKETVLCKMAVVQ